MKNIKKLCLIAVLGAMVTGGSLLPSTTAYAATTIPVSAGGDLAGAVAKAKSGDTIDISGTVKSKTIIVPSGVTITSTSKTGKVDFSLTGITGKGFVLNGTGSTISELEIYNAGDNGVFIGGADINSTGAGVKNSLTNLNIHNNNDAGVQLSNGAANNTLTNVNSHDNCDQFGKTDPKKRGENADGFAVKLGSGAGNKLIKCISKGNADDGYDLYAAHGAVYFDHCQAINNGSFNTGKETIYGDGNGFKCGGIDNKTNPSKPVAVAENHQLVGCIATGNLGAGFDRNNQTGIVTMTGCTAKDNKLGNYNWPAKGTPSAIGHEIQFGTAIIDNCTSAGIGANLNKLDGAKVTNSPTVK